MHPAGETVPKLALGAVALLDDREIGEVTLDAPCEVVGVVVSVRATRNDGELALALHTRAACDRLTAEPAGDPRPFRADDDENREAEKDDRDDPHGSILEDSSCERHAREVRVNVHSGRLRATIPP